MASKTVWGGGIHPYSVGVLRSDWAVVEVCLCQSLKPPRETKQDTPRGSPSQDLMAFLTMNELKAQQYTI